MDCNVILAKLRQIAIAARRADRMVHDASTGKQFAIALDDIEHAVHAIREEVWDISPPSKPFNSGS